jgi:hypothetical protein
MRITLTGMIVARCHQPIDSARPFQFRIPAPGQRLKAKEFVDPALPEYLIIASASFAEGNTRVTPPVNSRRILLATDDALGARNEYTT